MTKSPPHRAVARTCELTVVADTGASPGSGLPATRPPPSTTESTSTQPHRRQTDRMTSVAQQVLFCQVRHESCVNSPHHSRRCQEMHDIKKSHPLCRGTCHGELLDRCFDSVPLAETARTHCIIFAVPCAKRAKPIHPLQANPFRSPRFADGRTTGRCRHVDQNKNKVWAHICGDLRKVPGAIGSIRCVRACARACVCVHACVRVCARVLGPSTKRRCNGSTH